MAESFQENQEKSISEELDAALAQLSTDQIRFAIARNEYSTDKATAEAIGLKPDTVYHWPDVVRGAVRLMAGDGVVTALHLRKRSLAKAMAVKVKGLDSKDERLRQSVATEVVEWELGKATQTQKTEHSGEVDIHLDDARDRLAQFIARQAATGTADDDPGEPVE